MVTWTMDNGHGVEIAVDTPLVFYWHYWLGFYIFDMSSLAR